MNGPLKIKFQEIKSWMELTGNILSPKELEVIERLDRVYMRTVNG